MSTSVGVETFTDTSARGLIVLDPVEVLLVVLHRVDAVERERREEGVPRHRLAHPRHVGRVLVAEQVAAEAGLGALRVLELHDRRPLDRLLAHAEEAGRDLGDHVVVIGLQAVRVAALAGAGERIPGSCRPRPR